MDIKEICPCPNLDCPNHGYCDKCVSRHLRGGHLNFCAFYTILPTLQEAIEASPESPAAQKLQAVIGKQMQTYQRLMEKHGLTEENRDRLLKMVAEYGEAKA